MKILTVSDNVLPKLEESANLTRVYGDCEALISCGDMPAPYLEYISTVLGVPLYYVRGNHDTEYDDIPPGGHDLHRQFVVFKGISMAGIEGCIRYNDGPIQYTDNEMLFIVLSLWPRLLLRRLRIGYGVDLMVTHSPVRGIHDQQDRAHHGFKSFRLLLNLYRPRYLIHGHVDVLDRRKLTETTFGKTKIININPVKILTI